MTAFAKLATRLNDSGLPSIEGIAGQLSDEAEHPMGLTQPAPTDHSRVAIRRVVTPIRAGELPGLQFFVSPRVLVWVLIVCVAIAILSYLEDALQFVLVRGRMLFPGQ